VFRRRGRGAKGPVDDAGGPEKSWEIVAPIFTKNRRHRGWRALLPLQWAGRRRPLRKDGSQRHEYGDMQLICEAYAILKDLLGLDAPALAEIFYGMERR